MSGGGTDPKDLARYLALGQVGLEMVAPIGLGWFLDQQFGLTPGMTIAGALLGLVGGMAHLLILLRKPPGDGPGQEKS